MGLGQTYVLQETTWGYADMGGDSRGVAAQLSGGVQTVVGTWGAFAAVKVDGSVVTWGSMFHPVPVVGPGNYSLVEWANI